MIDFIISVFSSNLFWIDSFNMNEKNILRMKNINVMWSNTSYIYKIIITIIQMLFISILHETVLSLCESLIVFFFFTSTLDKQLIANNFNELFRLYNNDIQSWKLLLDSNQIKNTIERLTQKKMPDIVQWRTNKNIIKWKIVVFCSVLLLLTHIVIGVFFVIIKADPIPLILRNTALVGINACVEIMFAYMILKYRFI